jgi:hypothetical protein
MPSPALTDRERSESPAQQGATFTATQTAYMREKKGGLLVRLKKGAQGFSKEDSRPSALRAQETFERTLDTRGSQDFAKCKAPAAIRDVSYTPLFLPQGVCTWFQQAVASESRDKEVWTICWNARLVFMKINKDMILALSEEMVNGDVDVDRFVRKWERQEKQGGKRAAPGEGHQGRDATTKGKKGEEDNWFFNHYQAATTLLMKRLTDDARQLYTSLADKWRLQGPPPDEQSKSVSTFSIFWI